MKIVEIKKTEKEYFIVYKKNNEIFTFNGSAEEVLNELKRGSNDA
ncbi:MAG: hypothetical protein P1U29_04485 [Candidatus Pelagibacter bacterium]|jgi:hypothetical protein|nr:hypothetical protein [Candidatus Pelagibacter bacterium]